MFFLNRVNYYLPYVELVAEVYFYEREDPQKIFIKFNDSKL